MLNNNKTASIAQKQMIKNNNICINNNAKVNCKWEKNKQAFFKQTAINKAVNTHYVQEH